jgi:hypothetical protein
MADVADPPAGETIGAPEPSAGPPSGATMDVHKPKSVHGWREFLKEIGIIVLGVLIALSAEQAVEAVHWMQKIDQAEAAMKLELAGDDGPQGFVRAALAPCLADQLQRMHDLLQTGTDRKTFAALADAYRPPIRTWDSEAWDAVVASDVGSHMGAKRLVAWSTPYRLVPLLAQANLAEQDEMVELQSGRRSAAPFTAAEADRKLLLLDQLIQRNAFMAIGGLGILAGMEDAGAPLKPADRPKLLAGLRKVYGSCVQVPDPERFPRLGQYLPGNGEQPASH